jgi:branched-chain amino acid transport system permease protein
VDVLNSFVIPAIVSGALYTLVALGFNVFDRTTKIMNFAQGDLIMIAPMGVIVAMTIFGWPAPVAFLFGIVCSVGFGLLSEWLAFRPFLGMPNSISWILSGLAMSILIEEVASEPFGYTPQQMPIGLSVRAIQLGPIQVSPQSILLIVSAFVIFGLVLAFYRWTSSGRLLRAVGEDAEGAEVLGVSKRRAAQLSIVIASLIAAAGGLLAAPLLLVSPTFGFSLTFVGFVAVAIGGLSSIPGSLVGGMVVGFVQQATAVFLSAQWANVILFGTLLLVYLIRPWGLFGTRPVRTV